MNADVKALLRAVRCHASCLPFRLGDRLGLHRPDMPPVAFVTENADWAIRWVGEHIRDGINARHPETVFTTFQPRALQRRVVHFGSQYMWLMWGRALGGNNRYVTSFFHGKREDGPTVSRHIDEFLASVPRLSKVVTGAGIVERRLLDWGVPREKLVRIPIGVDTKLFVPPTPEQRRAARTKYAIPDGRIVIGSFQKDGNGWGDGMEPKLIKGPDVFLAAVERLARHLPVTVFLTGPARGYVKQGLEKLGVPHVHAYVQGHAELVECYHALDLYLMTSREEGGPMGVMESMASGVPVVAARTGMAPDLIEDGVTGGLAEVEDADGLCSRAIALLAHPDGGAHLRKLAREAVKVCDWEVVARDHYYKVYQPLMTDAAKTGHGA